MQGWKIHHDLIDEKRSYNNEFIFTEISFEDKTMMLMGPLDKPFKGDSIVMEIEKTNDGKKDGEKTNDGKKDGGKTNEKTDVEKTNEKTDGGEKIEKEVKCINISVIITTDLGKNTLLFHISENLFNIMTPKDFKDIIAICWGQYGIGNKLLEFKRESKGKDDCDSDIC